MGAHALNLLLRFLLEIAALGALGYWGWLQGRGGVRWLLALGVGVAAAAAWGVFAVPDDPSRSGGAPVPVPGAVRLALELALFAAAAWSLHASGLTVTALGFAAAVAVHYLLSWDRVAWLLTQ